MLFLILSIACAGLFCGAALYVNFVEHPARMACGPELALREFAPSYQRATVMQVSLAIGGLALGLTAAWRLHDSWVAVGAVLLGASVPFTLIMIFPTNKQLLDPTLDSRSSRVTSLFRRWNRLHAIRSLLSATAFGLLLCRVAVR
jgi:Anthrone oxygenase